MLINKEWREMSAVSLCIGNKSVCCALYTTFICSDTSPVGRREVEDQNDIYERYDKNLYY